MFKLYVIFFFFISTWSLYSSDFSFVSLINEYRNDRGFHSLVIEHNLNTTAEKYATVLMETGELSHVDSDGNRVQDRYRSEGGTAVQVGEILGTSSDLFDIFTAWTNSITHNTLILDPEWMRIGSSIIEKDGVYVAVVLFSNSSISNYQFVSGKESVQLLIKPITKDKEIFLPDYILNHTTLIKDNSSIEYSVRFSMDQLPLLLTIYIEIDGLKKMSDFLYIPDSK